MRIILRLLLYALTLVLGLVLTAIAGWPDYGREVIDLWQQHLATTGGRIASLCLGLLLMLIPLAIMVRWWASRRYAREISYVTEVGKVSVSLLAIQEALTRAVEHEPEVRKVAVDVHEDRVRRVVVIDAVLTLWDDGDVTGINQRCQGILRRRFGELMPECSAVQVHLTVHRLNQRRPGEASEHAPPRPLPAEAAVAPVTALPGLSLTQGAVGNEAGAALLARSRAEQERRRSEASEPKIAVLPDEQPFEPTPVTQPTLPEDEDGDDELYGQLYVGPTYPVDRDEDNDHDGGTSSFERR